jgi:hypothetical protein
LPEEFLVPFSDFKISRWKLFILVFEVFPTKLEKKVVDDAFQSAVISKKINTQKHLLAWQGNNTRAKDGA